MRKIISLVLTILLIATAFLPAYATNISIDNQNVQFTAESGAPFIDQANRTQVPFRQTMEQFGCTVSWDPINKIAIAEKNGTVVKVPIGASYTIKNGQQIANDTAALIKDNRTYLPIRAVLEAFGATVSWDGVAQTVVAISRDSRAEPELTVGFIYVGPANDGGYTEAHDNGRKAMESYFKGRVKTIYQETVAEDKQAAESAAVNMIEQGAGVIIGTSFGYMDALEELATKYPDVKFLHFSSNKMNDTNFGNYFGAMEEPKYLSGIVAGMMTKSNKIGYVEAFPYTELLIGINAFTLGARSVNPNVEVKVAYANAWVDAEIEKGAAEALLAQGCDIITQHCDTTGPQIAAEAAGAYAIPYGLDSRDVSPKAFLTAPVWHHEVFYIKTVQAILDGAWTPESYYGNMKDGYVALASMPDLVPADVKAKVEEVQAKIESGEFKIFTGPIKDNTGKVVVPKGTSLDRAGIWQIDYLVEGATEYRNNTLEDITI